MLQLAETASRPTGGLHGRFRQEEAKSLLSRGNAEGDPGRGDAPGSLAVLDRPEGLEDLPQGDHEVSVGQRVPRRRRRARGERVTRLFAPVIGPALAGPSVQPRAKKA